ncbi:MAG: hypothetical protein Q9171_006811 [Xanthocarpia ochracea]
MGQDCQHTMIDTASVDEADCIAIAQLDPSTSSSGKAVEGIVTLIWPYSISNQTFSILLAEPDFRLRRQRGQVRVQFRGSSAKTLADNNVQSGDHVKLSLLHCQWEKDETASGTPGRGIEWELRFEGRVVIKIQREDQEPINLDINHPEPSPERQIHSPPPHELSSQSLFPSTPTAFPAVPSRLQSWTTPAFLKRDRLSGNSFFGSDYDPFDEDDFRDNSRRKKTKFGRASNQWRFKEQDSSPESATRSISPATEPSAVNVAQDSSIEDQARIAEPLALENNNIERYEKQAEDHVTSHEHLVDAGVQVDDSLMSQPTPGSRTHDAATNPIEPSKSRSPTPEHYYSRTGRSEAEVPENLESAEVRGDTTTPLNKPIPSASAETDSLDQGAEDIAHDNAAKSPQSSQGRPPRLGPPRSSLQDGQRNLVELNEAAEAQNPVEVQDLPRIEADGAASHTKIDRYYIEGSVSDRLSRDERSASPVVDNSDLIGAQQESEPAARVTSPEEPQDCGFSRLTAAEHGLVTSLSTKGTEAAEIPDPQPQEPSPKVFDQTDMVIDRGSTEAVPELHVTQSQAVVIVKDEQTTATTSLAVNEIIMTLPDKQADSAFLRRSGKSSQSLSRSPEQVVTFYAQPSHHDPSDDDDEVRRQIVIGSVESEFEEDAQAQSSSPGMFGASDNEGEESSEEDFTMDDESRGYRADPKSDEGGLFSESEADNYYEDDIPSAKVFKNNTEDTQGDDNQVMAAPPRSSAVQIITIDDSDEDFVDVAQSETDGAIVSMSPGTSRQSPAMDSLLPKQKGGSPMPSSPPALPDTIPDSQAAVEVGKPGPEVESALPEAEEVNISSPSIARSIPESESREDPEELAEGAEAKAEFRAASISPEILLDNYLDPRLKNKVLTPSDTQPQNALSQASHISPQSLRETHDLPTPQLTQKGSSDILLPATLRHSSPSVRSSSSPASEAAPSLLSHRDESSGLIDQDPVGYLLKLKDKDKALNATKTSPRSRRVSNIPPSVSTWFAPKRSSEVVPDSRSPSPGEDENSYTSSSEDEADEEEEEEEIPSSSIARPYKPPKSKPLFQHRSSNAPLATSTPPAGLRTSHAYYSPLSNLPSHFNATTSTLSIILASTPIARANFGPRDYHTTLFLTDPSSLQENRNSQSFNSFQTNNLNTSAFTIARLFRPARLSLPYKPKQGDIILLRSCAVTSYSRTASLLSSNSSAWALFSHGHSEPVISGPPVEFGAEERGYVRGLWEWWEQLDGVVKEGVLEAVDERVKKMEEKEEREKTKGLRLKGMGLRLAPGMGKGKGSERHELRDGKEWSDDFEMPKTPRKGKGVRHELRDGKAWVDEE